MSAKPQRPDDNQQDTKSKRPAPALKQTSKCPNCGRVGAVVFSIPPPADAPDETHRLVCLDC
jgi:hypothetical protein